MFGLTKNRKNIEVRQTMTRFANRTFAQTAAARAAMEEKREETRHARVLPLLYAPLLDTEDEVVSNLTPGVSQDLSSEGFSMIAYGCIETPTILAVITDTVEMALLHCEVRHTRNVGYGYYHFGIRVMEKLRWGPFGKLRLAVEEYNRTFDHAEIIKSM